MNKTTALAGMSSGGISSDGDVVFFSFENQDATTTEFSCPHEAIGVIVAKFLNLAQMSYQSRGAPDALALPMDEQMHLRMQTVTDIDVRSSSIGVAMIVQCAALQYQFVLTAAHCKRLFDLLTTPQGPHTSHH